MQRTWQAASAPWHALSAEEVLSELGSDPARGLTAATAAQRLAEFGPNELEARAGPSRLAILASQFNSVLVWVLLAAALISGALLQEWIDASVILAIVLLNALIGYVQEARAEEALAKLKELAAPEALVLRDGEEVHVAAREVVPGDLVVLEAGDRVPADIRLVEVVHLEAEEAALTGESLPVHKTVHPVPEESGTGDRQSMVFAGTVIAVGRGRGVVVATGTGTEVGKIAELLTGEEPPTPLQVELDRVGKRIAGLVLVVAAVIFLLGLARSLAVESMFLIAVALGVAAIPEGLPAVVTVTLARGVQAMARERAIVRRLPAVEALGAASVICTDKTGTLTRNEIRVQELNFADLVASPAEARGADTRVRRYAEVAALCNDARATPDGYVGDPTEIALLISVDPLILRVDELRQRRPRLDEAGFDSSRKRMSTLHQVEEGYLLALKGAPEVVVERCDRFESEQGPLPLEAERRGRALQAAAELAGRGLRTLALAYRVLPEPPSDLREAEAELVLVGVVGMSDELRPETRPAVAESRQAGVRVVMVTGDHEVTARAIAEDLGLLGEGHEVMPGGELRRTSVADLEDGVERISVYARVDPADKVKIVKAWQAAGATVAMTGDGVNDAPALRAADIGVAMGSGTDVAKESSAMVLSDDNFATIVGAIRQGRAIFSNLKKVVYYLLSANVSEVLVMFFGFLLFGGLGEPLLATQLLWINLVTDGLPALALGLDPPLPALMRRPPEEQRDILGPLHQLRLLWQGAVLALGVLAAFAWGHLVREMEWEYVRTLAFTTLVTVQLIHVYNVRAQGTSVWALGFGHNRTLGWGVLASFVLQLGVVYLPVGNRLFETVPVQLVDWAVVAVMTVATFLAVDRVKRWLQAGRPAWRMVGD